jgi:hypothetical protein
LLLGNQGQFEHGSLLQIVRGVAVQDGDVIRSGFLVQPGGPLAAGDFELLLVVVHRRRAELGLLLLFFRANQIRGGE